MDKEQEIFTTILEKVFKFQFMMVCFLMITTTFTPSGEWSKWLYYFLPASLFVSETFPLTSKVVNNYIGCSSIILGIIICCKYYNNLVSRANKLIAIKSNLDLVMIFILSLAMVVSFLLLYFGYVIDFILEPETSRNGVFLTNYILFGLFSSAISVVIVLFLMNFFLSLLLLLKIFIS